MELTKVVTEGFGVQGTEERKRDFLYTDKYKSFEDEVRALQEGRFPAYSNVLVSEHTPGILQLLGADNLPVLWGPHHLLDALSSYDDSSHRHGLPEENVLNIMDIMNHPCFVFDNDTKRSQRGQDSIVMITNIMVPGGPLLMAVHVNGKGRYLDDDISAHYLSGVYGKRSNAVYFMLDRAITDRRLLYIDMNRTKRLFRFIGMEMPQKNVLDALPDRSMIHPSISAKNTRENPNLYNRRYADGQYQLPTHFSGRCKFLDVVKQGDKEHKEKNENVRQWYAAAGMIRPVKRSAAVSGIHEPKPVSTSGRKRTIIIIDNRRKIREEV